MFVYVACRAGGEDGGQRHRIAVFRLGAPEDPWRPIQELPVAEGVTGFVRGVTGNCLYALHGNGVAMTAFAIDATTGHAWPINRRATGGLRPSGAVPSPDGRSLLVVHAGGGDVSKMSLARDGALLAVAGTLALPGLGRAHGIALDPTGRFAVLADPGRNGLFVLRLGGADGSPGPHQFLAARPGDLPRRVLFHPHLPLLYVGNGGNPTVTAYHWHARAGCARFAQAIRVVPPAWRGTNAVTGLAFGRGGRRLYALNAGHDSIAMLAVQPGKGKMFLRSRDGTGGRSPRAFTWSDDGETMLVAHGADDRIARFTVSPINGTISHVPPDQDIPDPVALAVLG